MRLSWGAFYAHATVAEMPYCLRTVRPYEIRMAHFDQGDSLTLDGSAENKRTCRRWSVPLGGGE